MGKGSAIVDIPLSPNAACQIAGCGESAIVNAIKNKALRSVPTRRVLGGFEYGVMESDVHRWMQNRPKRGRPPKSSKRGDSREVAAE